MWNIISLINLTYIVSFVLVSGSYHRCVITIRCLKQIFSDLLWKQRPPKKPPWTQDAEDDQETGAKNIDV